MRLASPSTETSDRSGRVRGSTTSAIPARRSLCEVSAAASRRGLLSIAILMLLAWALPVSSAPAATARDAPALTRPRVVETTFKSVDATIAAQWDFPEHSPAPLVVLIPGGANLDRDGMPPGAFNETGKGIYAELADELVKAGFAVFRYDSPGTGRSSRGRFNTPRSDALEAYRRAVDHARVDAKRVFLLGHSYGTDAVAGIYSRYVEIAPPAGVILLASRVGETLAVQITAPTLIVVGEKNPDDHFHFGTYPTEARDASTKPKLETKLVTIPDAEHSLVTTMETNGGTRLELDSRAQHAIVEWLMQHRGVQGGI